MVKTTKRQGPESFPCSCFYPETVNLFFHCASRVFRWTWCIYCVNLSKALVFSLDKWPESVTFVKSPRTMYSSSYPGGASSSMVKHRRFHNSSEKEVKILLISQNMGYWKASLEVGHSYTWMKRKVVRSRQQELGRQKNNLWLCKSDSCGSEFSTSTVLTRFASSDLSWGGH